MQELREMVQRLKADNERLLQERQSLNPVPGSSTTPPSVNDGSLDSAQPLGTLGMETSTRLPPLLGC